MSMRAQLVFRREPTDVITIYGVCVESEYQRGAMLNPEDYLQDIRLGQNPQI